MKNEERYKSIKAEILGEDSDEESGSDSDEDNSEEEEGKSIYLYQPLVHTVDSWL